jgi:peptidoglycan/xylan/chitin deacetylase (PgdA/CDA1 family)
VSLRSLLKRGVERLLVLGVGRPARMRGQTLVLAYHNVVRDDDAGRGEAVLHLPLARFLRQLELLQRHCRVVSLSQALSEPATGDRPWVAITFDDAYRGAVELAVPELARRELPVTIFVAPGLLGTEATWWDALAEQPAGMSEQERQQVLTGMQGKASLVAPRLTVPVSLPPAYGCASEGAVRDLRRFPLVTLGAHTWHHPNLAVLKGAELEEELQRPQAWLAAAGVATVPVLAYPYGLTSNLSTAAAAGSGYTSALLVTGGWHRHGTRDRHATPRFNVPAGLSDDGFLLRLAGYFDA